MPDQEAGHLSQMIEQDHSQDEDDDAAQLRILEKWHNELDNYNEGDLSP